MRLVVGTFRQWNLEGVKKNQLAPREYPRCSQQGLPRRVRKIGGDNDSLVGSACPAAHHEKRLRQNSGQPLYGRSEQEAPKDFIARHAGDDQPAALAGGNVADGACHIPGTYYLHGGLDIESDQITGELLLGDIQQMFVILAGGPGQRHIGRRCDVKHIQHDQFCLPLADELGGAVQGAIATGAEVGGQQQTDRRGA